MPALTVSAAIALWLSPIFIQALTQSPQPFSTLLLSSDRNHSNDANIASVLHVPAGIYHASEYVIESSRLTIKGDSSRVIHSSPKESDSISDEDSDVSGRNNKENSRLSLFVMINSSISMNSICFDVRNPKTIVSWISSSTVTLTSCSIMCGGTCSPFVVDSHSGCDGSSISFVSCRHEPSTQNQLFPLVDFDSLTNPSFRPYTNADDDITPHSAAGTVSVTCVNHLMSGADLPLGTGPLLNFARISDDHHTPSSLSVETSLSHSRLLNVTSSPSPALRPFGSIGQSQKMIGVEVSECSNHLYGTVCDDMNNGGSVLCLNSSFSRCSTSLEPSSTFPTYTLQHRSGSEEKFELPRTDSSSVSFSHCTFHTMTSTSDGGAFVSQSSSQGISIAACSFVNCSSSDWAGNGGAVSISFSSSSPKSVSISSSLFTGSFAENNGGTLYINSPQTTSISDCYFVGTGIETSLGGILYLYGSTGDTQICHCLFSDSSAWYGGAAYLNETSTSIVSFSSFISCNGSSLLISSATSTVHILSCELIESEGTFGGGIRIDGCPGLLTVKDTLFDQCTATYGGGLDIAHTPLFKLDNLKFRACTGSYGKDVRVEATRTEVIEGNMVTNCVSTSGEKNVYFTKESSPYDSTLIPHVDSIDVPSITLSASLDGDDVDGSLRVTANASVDGRMLVVLDNSGSDYEKPNLDSPPPIARLFVFDFSSSDTASQSVLFNEWNLLQYEANYSMTMASLAGTDITLSPSLLQTPNPARIVEVITDWSSSEPEQLSFQLKGRTLSSGDYTVKVKDVEDLTICVSFTGQPTNPSVSRNMHSTKATLLLFGEGSQLTFDTKYEIESVQKEGEQSLLILEPPRLVFTTPKPAGLMLVTAASFEFVNGMKTSCKLILGGTDLALEGEFNFTLEPPLSIIVSFSSATHGESEELRIGWPDTLQYGQNYTIKSITRSISEYPAVFVDSDVNFTTGPKPASILLFVNSSGSSSLLCGDVTRPCSSMDVGLLIVSGIGFARSEVKIVEKGTQNTVHSMSSGSVLSMSASSSISATLEIGSMPSASMGSQSGLFVVSSGRLEFHEISVSILPTDPSFVLVSGSNSTLVLKNTSFFGSSSDTSSNSGDMILIRSSPPHSEPSNESEFVCDWSTGLFQLSNCSTNITSTQLHDLVQGAIRMKNGKVDIETSTFHNNGHRHSSFPSAGQNIHCSDGGVVKIGSLLGGDGSSDTHPHLWIAADECQLSGDEIQPDHPLFIPTLSTKSTCSLNKKEKEFTVTILGSTLIPCGLSLEVFEVGKDANVEKSKKIELTANSTLSFTETNITFSLPLASLDSLDSSLEWRGRLVFGEEQRTAESFLIQSDSSSSFHLVVPSDPTLQALSPKTSVNHKEASQPTVEPRNVIPVENRVEAMSCGGEMKTVVVNKMDTLYERLHTSKMVFARRNVEQMIVRGMMQLMEKRHEETGLRLSSHWVLFDSQGEVCLKLGNEAVDVKETHAATSTQPKVKEDIRWQAPEQKRREDGEEEKEVNAGLMSVFRLGLVLYEIETGLVPFGEMDDVNACRALHSGTLPKMDGVDTRMAELISSCLSLTPAARPSLSAIAISLSEIPESLVPGRNPELFIS
ncbi:hypothetical protein BLNAU_9903 [Blattamonas nauphoetae]|uniref:Serine-threonine/tyrosine-protein kinase catalytic domain-containing protein n=1 Tax=Blattamonas nauphoetae TaxID=2049346 RepID=A0ABQ9XUL9_9EUKA|nr:hypothetical protein BLNAU_9903 [Blattamonas nauphoetae]